MPHFFAIIATRSHNNLNHNLCQKSVQTQVFAGAVESSMLINSAWADASRGKLFSKKKTASTVAKPGSFGCMYINIILSYILKLYHDCNVI